MESKSNFVGEGRKLGSAADVAPAETPANTTTAEAIPAKAGDSAAKEKAKPVMKRTVANAVTVKNLSNVKTLDDLKKRKLPTGIRFDIDWIVPDTSGEYVPSKQDDETDTSDDDDAGGKIDVERELGTTRRKAKRRKLTSENEAGGDEIDAVDGEQKDEGNETREYIGKLRSDTKKMAGGRRLGTKDEASGA